MPLKKKKKEPPPGPEYYYGIYHQGGAMFVRSPSFKVMEYISGCFGLGQVNPFTFESYGFNKDLHWFEAIFNGVPYEMGLKIYR